jgi:hypothetical protein
MPALVHGYTVGCFFAHDKIWGRSGGGLDGHHRRRRKLHPGDDADTHEMVAVELTPEDVGDVPELPDLLDKIDADVASMT